MSINSLRKCSMLKSQIVPVGRFALIIFVSISVSASVCLASSQCPCDAYDMEISHVTSGVDVSVPTDLTANDGECENTTHSCTALSCEWNASSSIFVSSLDPNTSGHELTKTSGQNGADPKVTTFTSSSTSFGINLPVKAACDHYKQYHVVFEDDDGNETGSATIDFDCGNCTANF